MTSCRFSRWQIEANLHFRGAIMSCLKRPCTTFYRSSIETVALICLVFEKIAFLYFGDRQTNKQTDRRTDGQARCMKPLSLSPAAAVAVVSGGLTRLEKARQPRQVCCWFKRKKIAKNFKSIIVKIFSTVLCVLAHRTCAKFREHQRKTGRAVAIWKKWRHTDTIHPDIHTSVTYTVSTDGCKQQRSYKSAVQGTASIPVTRTGILWFVLLVNRTTCGGVTVQKWLQHFCIRNPWTLTAQPSTCSGAIATI